MSAPQSDLYYCVDTSAFVDLRVRYPKDVFPGVWNSISDLAKARRMIAPGEVRRELKIQADEILQWAKMRRGVFLSLDAEEQRILREILAQFPDLVDPGKQTPDADPFVVALAVGKSRKAKGELLPTEWFVVTQEGKASSGRPKIPNVCAAYGIQPINLLDMFRRERWTFS